MSRTPIVFTDIAVVSPLEMSCPELLQAYRKHECSATLVEEFRIKTSNHEIQKLETLGDIYSLINSYTSASTALANS